MTAFKTLFGVMYLEVEMLCRGREIKKALKILLCALLIWLLSVYVESLHIKYHVLLVFIAPKFWRCNTHPWILGSSDWRGAEAEAWTTAKIILKHLSFNILRKLSNILAINGMNHTGSFHVAGEAAQPQPGLCID